MCLRLNAIENIFDDILDKTKENYLVYSSVKEKYVKILDNLLLDINNFEKNLINNENVINNNDRIDSVFSSGLEEIIELYEFKALSLKKEFTND